MASADQVPQGGGWVFALICVLVCVAVCAVAYGPAVVSWAAGWWSALGGNVDTTWAEVALRSGPTEAEIRDVPPYDWAKELRQLGRPVAPSDQERRAA